METKLGKFFISDIERHENNVYEDVNELLKEEEEDEALIEYQKMLQDDEQKQAQHLSKPDPVSVGMNFQENHNFESQNQPEHSMIDVEETNGENPVNDLVEDAF